ncbi:MAG: nucleotidyltransferase domain-containing protein [Vicinamibacterales bacterium]
MPAPLHRQLQNAARQAGISLNEYCVRRLAAGGTGVGLRPDAAALVVRASEVAGRALLGVVLHGSWVRGTAGPSSDVDALIVIDAGIPLRRDLYTRWDARSVTWEGRPVDPHFVHVPEAPAGAGVWAEASVEGVVLFEIDGLVSAALAAARREIANGRLLRRLVHGQPYWVTVERSEETGTAAAPAGGRRAQS